MKLGESLGIQGTPTYMLDGKQLSMAPFTPKDNSVATFQANLKTFLEKYVAQTSGAVQPTVTTAETGATIKDDGLGGITETTNS